MTDVKKKDIFDRIWDIFASVKTAVVIFALISMTSIVGTVIEQQADPEKNIKLLERMFGLDHDSGHSVLVVLDKLGFTDMYHSWWFLAFLLLFGANLIVCSLDRLPRIWKLVQEKIHPVPVDYIEKMSIRNSVTLKGKTTGIREKIISAMGSIGFKPAESSEEKSVQFFAERGNYTRLGVYIVHLSILIILAGAIIGIFFGYNAFLNLPEGEISSVAHSATGQLSKMEEQERGAIISALNALEGDISKAADNFGVAKNILMEKMKRYGIHSLGFTLRCDNFEVEYYPNSEMPKAYKSWLVVLKNGQEVMKKSIVVNDPLKFEGVTFYQSSFGVHPDGYGRGIVILKVTSRDGRTEQLNLRLGESFTIPGTSVQGKMLDFSPALSFDENGKAFTFNEHMVNPAIFVEFSGMGNQNFSGWIMKRYPNTWNLPDGNRVEFVDLWGALYTGMQVRKDPGVGIVYLGCIIMAVGLYMTFFMSHRRIWVSLIEDKGGSRVVIGASSNRNRAILERKVEKLVNLIGPEPKGGK